MENSDCKEFNLNKIQNFLSKVQSKLSSGVEDIGKENEKVVSSWLDEVKTISTSVKVDFNKNLFDKCIEIQKENPEEKVLGDFYTKFEIFSSPSSTHMQKDEIRDYLSKHFNNIPFDEGQRIELEEFLINILNEKNEWETLNAVVYIMTIIIQDKMNFSIEKIINSISLNFNKLIQHPEYRLRSTIPKLIKEASVRLIENDLVEPIKFYSEQLLEDIFRNFNIEDGHSSHKCETNECSSHTHTHTHNNNIIITLDTSKNILIELLNTVKSNHLHSKSKELCMLDMKIIQNFVDNLDNANKGVRLVSYELLQTFLNYLQNKEEIINMLPYLKSSFKENVLLKLSFTLVDFYPQVRFSSLNFLSEFNSFCIKKLDVNLLKEKYFYIFILPKICVNRYLPIEGVKKSSLNLWKEVVNFNGIRIIKENIENFVNVYLAEMTSKSHQAREASCRCLQELIMKVYEENLHSEIMFKKINLIIDLTSNCIKDACWSVREAALNTSGYLVKLFKMELLNENSANLSSIISFIDLIQLHLFDNIIEVRDSAAFAIRILLTSFNKEELILINKNSNLTKFLINLIDKLSDQNSIEKSYEEVKNSIFENVKNNTFVQDLGFMREIESWEHVDAIIHLIKEFAEEEQVITNLSLNYGKLITLVSDYFCKNYNTLQNLSKKTFWLSLSSLYKKLKKSDIEIYLELILDFLIREIRGKIYLI